MAETPGNGNNGGFASVDSAELAGAEGAGALPPVPEEGSAGSNNGSAGSNNSSASLGIRGDPAAKSLANLALAPGEEEGEEEGAGGNNNGSARAGNNNGSARAGNNNGSARAGNNNGAAAAAVPAPAPATKAATGKEDKRDKAQKQADEAKIRELLKSKGLPTGLVWVPRFDKFRREKGEGAFMAKIEEFERRKGEAGINPVALGLVSQAEANARTAAAARNRERRGGVTVAAATAAPAATAKKATVKKANGAAAMTKAPAATKAKTAAPTAGFKMLNAGSTTEKEIAGLKVQIAHIKAQIEPLKKLKINVSAFEGPVAELEKQLAAKVEKLAEEKAAAARAAEEAAAARAARNAETAVRAARAEAFEKARSNLKAALGGANASNSFVSAFMLALEGKANLTPDLFAKICGALNKTRKERKNKGVSRKGKGSATSAASAGSKGSTGSAGSKSGAGGAGATAKAKAPKAKTAKKAAAPLAMSLKNAERALKNMGVAKPTKAQIRAAAEAGVE